MHTLKFWMIGVILLLTVAEGSCRHHSLSHGQLPPVMSPNAPQVESERMWWMLFQEPLLTRILATSVNEVRTDQTAPAWSLASGSYHESYEAAPLLRRKEIQAAATRLQGSASGALLFIQAVSLHEQISATKAILRINQRLLELTEQEKQSTPLRRIHLFHAQAEVQRAQHVLAPLQREYHQTVALLGNKLRPPLRSNEIDAQQLSALHLRDIPDSFSSQLLEQRPDMRAATQNLALAMNQVGLQMPIQLPYKPISAQTASQALQAMELFNIDAYLGAFPNLALLASSSHGIVQKKHGAVIAEYTRSLFEYKATVLNALENAADCIIALQQDTVRDTAAQATESAEARMLKSTIAQFRKRNISLQARYAVEISFHQARIVHAQTAQRRISDAVLLLYALGGPWWS